MTTSAELFEAVVELPDRTAQHRYDALVGVSSIKEQLSKEAQLLLCPDGLDRWSTAMHGVRIAACDTFVQRPPMFLFAGDVGTGKTALAETFGDEVARSLQIPVFLYRLSLASRGSGAVGEMTQLLAAAFEEVRRSVGSTKQKGTPSSAVILLIDEADALAQSRETAQMHHEDRAGVNALIRGLNGLTEQHLPILVVLATNRLGAIDPAVRRRAAATFEFGRPDEAQRREALNILLAGITFGPGQLDDLVKSTGQTSGRDYGYTYSDLYQRLVPAAILAAYPDKPLTAELLLATAAAVEPTPPFISKES
jgi:SpoVK/Ycf46/Vps4 family AAA+-type ATPase